MADHPMRDEPTGALLSRYATLYETPRFLEGDPSMFMHRVEGDANKEATALVASCLSYGRRTQFMPKIVSLLRHSHGDVAEWIVSGRYASAVPDEAMRYYRLHTCHHLHSLLAALADMLRRYGSVGAFVRGSHPADTLGAIEALIAFFAPYDTGTLMPLSSRSACKRLCMFMRWMVRDHSPVDVGIWSDIIDKRTLIMPLDAHVMEQSRRLALLPAAASPSMSTALRLTNVMRRYFPDDPLRGDFALFGYGVDPSS